MTKSLKMKISIIDEVSKKLQNIGDLGKNAFSDIETASVNTDKAMQKTVHSTSKTAVLMDKLSDNSKKASETEKKFADSLDKTEKQAKQFSSAMDKAADSSNKLGRHGANAGELLENAFTAIGIYTGIMKIKDAFVSCSAASIEFESAVTGVYKTVDGTPEQLAEISDEVKQMSLEIPSTTTEIAGVAETAGQLGIETDNITDFTRVMIDLGEATNLSSDEAASSLAKFANITGMSADNYENLGSVIVALGNNFATTETDIVATATRMASAGTIAGLSETDIFGLATAISSVGIEAEAGGSAMSTLLSEIQVAVETGNGSLEDFASVANMTAESFQTAFKTDAAGALYAFIDGLNDVERNGATATVILENMGLTEIRLSNAIKSLASNSDGLSSALSLSKTAWEENTALAKETETRYGTLESKIDKTKNSFSKLKISIGDVLTPTIGVFSEKLTEAFIDLSEFADENPIVVEGITGMTVAIVGTVGAVTAASTAVKAFNTITNTLNVTLTKTKVGLIITGIAAVGTAVGGVIHYFNSAEEEVEDYNGTLENCRKEINATEAAYRKAAKRYGENSDAATDLKNDLATLNAQYEKGGGEIAEYTQRLEASHEAFRELSSAQDEAMKSIDTSEMQGLQAVSMLEALSEKAVITNADLDMMGKYADYLNDDFNCNIKINYDTGEITGFDPETVARQIVEEAKQNKVQAAFDYLQSEEFYNGFSEAYKNYSELTTKYNSDPIYSKGVNEGGKTFGWINSDEKAGEISNVFSSEVNSGEKSLTERYNLKIELDEAEKELNEFYREIEEKALIYDPTGKTGEYLKNSYIETVAGGEKVVAMMEESDEAVANSEEAWQQVFSSQTESITAFQEAYAETYAAIRSDVEGMFGLFEEVSVNHDEALSMDTAKANLESQIAYFEQYGSAIQKLSELEIDNSIISQLDPEQAIAFAEELSGLDSETAEAKVSEMNLAFEKLSSVEDTVAEKLTAADEELNSKLSDMQIDIEDAVDDWNLQDTAADSAEKTINGFISVLRSGGNTAVIEAYNIRQRIEKALATTGTFSISTGTENSYNSASGTVVEANATGTTYSDDVYIAGEEGPELIIGRKGSTVFPTSQTDRIIDAVSETKALNIPNDNSIVLKRIEQTENNSQQNSREINLNINGNGRMHINGSASKEQVVAVMIQHLKPVLMNMISQEIFEEGENSYEF